MTPELAIFLGSFLGKLTAEIVDVATFIGVPMLTVLVIKDEIKRSKKHAAENNPVPLPAGNNK